MKSAAFLCLMILVSQTTSANQRKLADDCYHMSDYVCAHKAYSEDASNGDGYSEFKLGFMTIHGLGCNKNISDALNWYRRSADHGYVEGQLVIAHMLEEGKHIAQDYQAAVKYYKLAVDQNSMGAQYGLAELYLAGKGVKPDRKEALRLFKLVAARGDPDAISKVIELEPTYFYRGE